MNRLLLGFILVAFSVGAFKVFRYHPKADFQLPAKVVASNNKALLQSGFASSKQHIQTHAASLVELKDGRIRAFWFAGSREGAKDVVIRSAVFDPAQGVWGAEQTVASREETQQSLLRYVSKLGNPVAGRAADGRLFLYYVTVSMGGWAGSSITTISSTDEGQSWSPAKRLITSPFLNISTLIKGTPFRYRDGTMGLPVYHEFISKFGEILHLDKNGAILAKQRLSAGGGGALQPVVLVQNQHDALALMRYSGADTPRRLIRVSTSDGGRHWTTPAKSTLANPDAAISALTLADGQMLAVLNNQERGRDALSLMSSADGGDSWQTVYQLENETRQATDEAHYLKTVEGLVKATDARAALSPEAFVDSAKAQVCHRHQCHFEFSYPYLIQTKNGDFHLVYTWNRAFIKHVWFNHAWLQQRLQESTHD